MKIALIALGTVGTASTAAWQCETVREWLGCCCEAICRALGVA
jgi:hypothetical protein